MLKFQAKWFVLSFVSKVVNILSFGYLTFTTDSDYRRAFVARLTKSFDICELAFVAPRGCDTAHADPQYARRFINKSLL